MENIKLPFQIGTQYEEWEFQLEPIEHEISNGVDSYTYLDKLLLLGVIVKETKLHFYLDILVVVQLHIEENLFLQSNNLTKFLESNINLKYHFDDVIELWVLKNNNCDIQIIYGNPTYIEVISKNCTK